MKSETGITSSTGPTPMAAPSAHCHHSAPQSGYDLSCWNQHTSTTPRLQKSHEGATHMIRFQNRLTAEHGPSLNERYSIDTGPEMHTGASKIHRIFQTFMAPDCVAYGHCAAHAQCHLLRGARLGVGRNFALERHSWPRRFGRRPTMRTELPARRAMD